jgi:hypothetical protein
LGVAGLSMNLPIARAANAIKRLEALGGLMTEFCEMSCVESNTERCDVYVEGAFVTRNALTARSGEVSEYLI